MQELVTTNRKKPGILSAYWKFGGFFLNTNMFQWIFQVPGRIIYYQLGDYIHLPPFTGT